MVGVSIKNLYKEYDNNGRSITALKNINCDIEKGEFVSFVGPSGCGKTTLLKTVAGLLSPTNGEIIFNGNDKPKINIMFQDPLLFPWRTIRQNIALPLEIKHQHDNKRIEELLQLVGLDQFSDRLPSELSGGMKQRTSLARSLVTSLDILLMDEPFGALDELTRNKLNLELLHIWQEVKFTCLFVTHSISEAVLLSDKVIVLSDLPAVVKDNMTIDLPRPRSLDIKDTQEFIYYTKCIRNTLQQKT